MDRLNWYVNRLRAMSVFEIFFRVQQRLQSEKERFSIKSLNLSPGESETPSANFSRLSFRHLFLEWDCKVFRNRFPEEVNSILESARAILADKVTFFGYKEVILKHPFDWHYDPVLERKWPEGVFYADIDHRWGGAKTIWELSRHQHLVTLAQAFFLTKNQEYLKALEDYLESWLDQDPPLTGVHWTSGLELSMRIISWVWVDSLIGEVTLRPGLKVKWEGSILAHGKYLENHLSRYSSANNHLIGEALGLFLVGLFVPGWHRSGFWRREGLKILEMELLKQINPDGTSAEQSTHYLGFVLDMYLLFVSVAKANQVELSETTYARLEKIGEFLMAIMDTDGQVQAIGDEDGGFAYRLSGEDVNLVLSRLASLAIICNRPDFKKISPAFDSRSWWLFGERSLGEFASPPEVEQDKTNFYAFPIGGYWILRSGLGSEEKHLVFDCGTLGYLSLAAHGHADCLSVWLSLGGKPFLVDSGTYKYHEDLEWRRFFRGTSAHNTVCVDGADQSIQTGPTIWGSRAKQLFITSSQSEGIEWVEGQHDGYTRFPSPAIHRRGVAFIQRDYYVIVDWILGEGEHQIESTYHFPPGAAIDKLNDEAFKISVDGRVLFLLNPTEMSRMAQTVTGNEDPIQGWVSPRFWEKLPAPTLTYTLSGCCPRSFFTVIWPGERPLPVLHTYNVKTKTGVRFDLFGMHWRDHFFFDVAEPELPVTLGDDQCFERIGNRRASI
jgi:hypothetical protein